MTRRSSKGRGRKSIPPKYRGLKPRRVNTVQAPRPSLLRRLLRLVFNPVTISLTLLVCLVLGLTLTYFWIEFSDRIDTLLRGEVFTSTAGIYAAPKTLRQGERITPSELEEYLSAAGYIKKNLQADQSRSRYEIRGKTFEIEPGKTARIDGEEKFPTISVTFAKDKKSVASIKFTRSGKEIGRAQLEPKILSSITAEGDGKRKVIEFNDLPPHLIKAITVTEDRAFFDHYGVNFRGIGRALWRRYEKDNDRSPLANQGGSSITQQLVKNLLLNRDKTLERKLKEAYMSVILETRLTKEQIFTLYANQIYLGQQTGVAIYGVGEAARTYFGKDVSELTLAESAFIAGIIRSPNRYNAWKNPEKVQERRNQVLNSMVETGALSPGEAIRAKKEPLRLDHATAGNMLEEMPYFSQFAVEEVPKIISDPEALQHLRIYTTIDPDLQKIAYRIVNKRLARLDRYYKKKKNLQAALVAIRPKTGEIVAMVGGRDYRETQFNRAADAKRQPGSVFKPFVYSAAINSAYSASPRVLTAASVFTDEKREFRVGREIYAPNNYGDFFSGQDITLRDALVKSKNTITVSIGMELGISRVMDLAHKAGLPKVDRAYPSMALGTSEATPLEMATAYTTFANLGERVAPQAIRRVTNGDGETVTAPTAQKKRVLRSDVAYIVNDMLKDVINRGTAAQAQGWGFRNVPGKSGFAGKTGTSRDGWFAGYTPEIVCVVYVGFDDGSDLGMKGSDSAMPIWAEFMREALRLYPDWNGDWEMPASIRKAEIDIRDGKLIKELFDSEAERAAAAEQKNEPNDLPANTALSEEDEVIAGDEDPLKKIYVTEIPPEFRRIELFIGGTLPNRKLKSYEEPELPDDPDATAPAVSPTPFSTWEEAEQEREETSSVKIPKQKPSSSARQDDDTVSVMICRISRMRSTIYCPVATARSFRKGKEPRQNCPIHARIQN